MSPKVAPTWSATPAHAGPAHETSHASTSDSATVLSRHRSKACRGFTDPPTPAPNLATVRAPAPPAQPIPGGEASGGGRSPPELKTLSEIHRSSNASVELATVRAPAPPAQPIPGGRLRKGGEAPLRVEKPVGDSPILQRQHRTWPPFEHRLRRRNPVLGEASEGPVEAPSDLKRRRTADGHRIPGVACHRSRPAWPARSPRPGWVGAGSPGLAPRDPRHRGPARQRRGPASSGAWRAVRPALRPVAARPERAPAAPARRRRTR